MKIQSIKKDSLLSGALVLSFAGILAKIFSAAYRIVLTRILGPEGIGLYQLIFPLYSLFVVLSTGGLPMAISKVVAKNKGKEKLVLKKCFKLSGVVSLILMLILFLVSIPLSKMQGEKELAICYLVLAPSILIITSSSVLKGFFQGINNFKPTSISNIFEQFSKLLLGLILSLMLLKKGLIYAIIGAVVAIDVSEIVSLAILLMCLKFSIKKKEKSSRIETRDLIQDIVPITLTNIILPISIFIDSILVVKLLEINFSHKISVMLYGIESGAITSLINLPTIFSFSLASVILPNIVSQISIFNSSQKLVVSMKIILIITIPCAVLFLFVPDKIIFLLYGDRLKNSLINGSYIAGRLLAISSFGVVFFAINQIYSSVLQAVNRRVVTIKNLLISVGVKFLVEFIFLPSWNLNIYALAFSLTACYLTNMMLNHFEIREIFKLKFDFDFAGKLTLSNFIMIAALLIALNISTSLLATMLAFVLAGLIYLLCLITFDIFSKREIAMFKFKN